MLPSVGMSEQRWCTTLGKNTQQCAWRRRYGFAVPLPPRGTGWSPPKAQLGTTARETMGTNMIALVAILGIAGAAMLIPVAHWLIKGD